MTREEIKAVAIKMAKESGLINLSRIALCDRVGIPDGSFPHVMGCNFSTLIDELKAEVVETKVHAVNKSRADPSLRRDSILSAALELSKKRGYANIKRDEIADRAGVSMGLVTRYFGTMVQLRRAVIRTAITRGVPEIIAQGLANGDPHAAKAPTELKERAATLLAKL